MTHLFYYDITTNMIVLTTLDNLKEIISYLYPKRPTMVDLWVLLKDGVKEIKIRGKGNFYLIIYEFIVDAKRYQEIKEAFENVSLTTHRWNGVNQTYITVTISQRFDSRDLRDESLMHRPMKGLFDENDDDT